MREMEIVKATSQTPGVRQCVFNIKFKTAATFYFILKCFGLLRHQTALLIYYETKHKNQSITNKSSYGHVLLDPTNS